MTQSVNGSMSMRLLKWPLTRESSMGVRSKANTAKLLGLLITLSTGSVKPENSDELAAEPDIDGFLVGGASLKAGDFLKIISSATVKSHAKL